MILLSSRLRTILLVLSASQMLTACSSIEYPMEKAPRMLVLHDSTPFFLHGPAQGNGADRMLAKGDEVKALRKEFGYSFVQLGDGQKGFVANEELVVAPPESSPVAHLSSGAVPEEKTFPSLPAFETDTNVPLAPPGFRY